MHRGDPRTPQAAQTGDDELGLQLVDAVFDGPPAPAPHSPRLIEVEDEDRRASVAGTRRQLSQTVSAGPPAPAPHSPRLIEVEDQDGRSVVAGPWRPRSDGTWAMTMQAHLSDEQAPRSEER